MDPDQPRDVTWEILSPRLNDLVVMADASSTIFYVSPACRTLGYAQHEMIGRGPADFLHPQDLASFQANTDAVFDPTNVAGAPSREHRFRCKDSSWVWLQGNPSAIRDAEGAAIGIINVFRDVTDRRATEDWLKEALAEAERLAAVKSEFLANMSHEIRTPLTAVLGFTSLLGERGDLDPAARAQVERVASAGRALLAIVNDVLDYSSLEAGQVALSPRTTPAAAVVSEVVEMFEPAAEAKGLALSFEAAPDGPAALRLDADRLRQILVNLVGNAVKFTDRGAVRVSLAYDREAGRLSVDIADTGPGIAAAAREKLFQRFSQLDGSTTRAKGGTGLGLAISRKLAQAMDGDISLKSRVGRGSTFRLELPAPVAEAPPLADASAGALAILDGVRVLVVDDNPINRELARAILEPAGVEVSEAADGAEGVAAARRMPVDLILMDLRMPGLHGREAAAAIRRTPGPNQDIPILAFSADCEMSGGPAALGPFDGQVRKPVSPAALIAALAEAMGETPEPALPDVRLVHG